MKEAVGCFLSTVVVYGVENIAPADDMDLALNYLGDQARHGCGNEGRVCVCVKDAD